MRYDQATQLVSPISDPATAPQHQSLRLCRGTAAIFLQLLEGFLHHDAGPGEDRIFWDIGWYRIGMNGI